MLTVIAQTVANAPHLGCCKTRCNKWGLRVSGLSYWNPVFSSLLLPFSPFWRLFHRAQSAPEESRKRIKNNPFRQMSSDLLKPPFAALRLKAGCFSHFISWGQKRCSQELVSVAAHADHRGEKELCKFWVVINYWRSAGEIFLSSKRGA